MKFLLIALFALCATALVLEGDSDVEARKQWDAFKYQYDMSFSPIEEAERFEIFKTNLALIEKYNSNEPHRPYGVTKFAHLSEEEFKEAYLMKVEYPESTAPVDPSPAPEALPTTFDWRTKGNVVTPVKNQGQCGSCWDFSATETMESVCSLAGYGLKKFSEQQIVDCDHDGVYGCNGGFPDRAYEYIIQVGGIESEADYPYTAQDGSCQANSSEFEACKITSYQFVSGQSAPQSESTMQTFTYQNSPLSICVDASSWQFYNGGVLMGNNCGQQLDHCVQITGWSEVQGTKAWAVRNSWGANWGNEGYIWLQYGTNTCGLATYSSVPCITGTDGKKYC